MTPEEQIASLESQRAADRAFYELTVAQRDRAWREVEALREENERLTEALAEWEREDP